MTAKEAKALAKITDITREAPVRLPADRKGMARRLQKQADDAHREAMKNAAG